MAYSATLGDSQHLAIANLGMQTQINLTMSSSRQQQSQSSSFSTGKWTSKPKLFNTGQGFILQIDTERDSHYVLIQQNSISTIQSPGELNNYSQVNLQEISDSNSKPLDFEPMQPLKMGNMSMDINSMSMQMGNMSMNLNDSTATKQFCSSCGTEAKVGDRFCRNCGHELNQ